MSKKTKDESKKAFILMPFKSKTSVDYDVYQSVFEESIKPLLEELGYSAIKAEQPKQVTSLNKELSVQLMKADLVIADISSLNPNFYYRLDIRFRINSLPTILLVSEDVGTISQFDTTNYPTINYKTDIEGLKSLANNLLKLISEFNFPFNKIDFDDLDPTEKISKAIIDVHRNLVPEYIIKEMESSVSDNDIRKFIECVQNFLTLESFKPSERDYALVYFLSDKIKEGSIVSKAILDIGLKDFPESERLFALYVICLSASQRQIERNQAKTIVKEKLKISITSTSVEVNDVNTLSDIDLISWMLDAYHKDGEHKEALRITSSLYRKFKDNAVVLRNHARALEKTREASIEFILNLYQKAMFCLSVDVTTARWYASTLIEHKRFLDAIEVLLFACLLGLDDPENFSRLAYVTSNLIQPSNPIVMQRMTGIIPQELNMDVVLGAIILSESCEDFSAKHRFMNENALRNIGAPKEYLSNYYLDKYKGGDISRPDRSLFVSNLYNKIKTDKTSAELFNSKKQSNKSKKV